jgi:hypothetical protein
METLQPQEPEGGLFDGIKTMVNEARQQAINAWRQADVEDTIEGYLGGAGLAVFGAVVSIAGRQAHLPSIEGLGYVYSGLGGAAMVGSYLKMMELGVRSSLAGQEAGN